MVDIQRKLEVVAAAVDDGGGQVPVVRGRVHLLVDAGVAVAVAAGPGGADAGECYDAGERYDAGGMADLD